MCVWFPLGLGHAQGLQVTSTGPRVILKAEGESVILGCGYTLSPLDRGELDIEWSVVSPDTTKKDQMVRSSQRIREVEVNYSPVTQRQLQKTIWRLEPMKQSQSHEKTMEDDVRPTQTITLVWFAASPGNQTSQLTFNHFCCSTKHKVFRWIQGQAPLV